MSQFHTTFRPEQIHASVFIAEGAIIVGDVTIGENCGVWFQASLRADTEPITIGAGSNIQEAAIFHADPGFPAIVGEGVTIGHRAIVHGAQIRNDTLIGMGAILLNGAVIEENCIVGAGALVTEGKKFPAGTLILGSPAKVVRDLKPEEFEQIKRAAEGYRLRAKAFRGKL
ncbi:MAG: gamma carbonic anhydrase family protein [Chloroflexota bacterium]